MNSSSPLRPGAIALVTGASSGIGASTARMLADHDCRVVCAGRRVDALNEVVEPLGDHAVALELDVTDRASVASLLERLPREWREVDALVNSAGHDVGGRRAFHQGTAEEWAAIIDTNVTGLVRVTRQVIDTMLARDRGHVVNIGSTAGISAYATGSLYVASKHAVHGFSESLRLDYAGTGIRVTEILPGMVRTNFALNRWSDAERAERFYDDFGTCLSPDDVARTVLFALEQPAHVVVSQLVIVPSAQS